MRGSVASRPCPAHVIYGYVAARVRGADRVMLPVLDILQSIPVLGFIPGVVLALAALFPRTNLGLELAAVLMIFTGQVWNMTFSFYHSLQAIPSALIEAVAGLSVRMVAAIHTRRAAVLDGRSGVERDDQHG